MLTSFTSLNDQRSITERPHITSETLSSFKIYNISFHLVSYDYT